MLDKTITVFRYVTEKDVFERYYKGHLAKRLLQSRSVAEDAERAMLMRLKVECGYQFTQKLEGMFNDIKLSEEAMDLYQTHLTKTTVSIVASLTPPPTYRLWFYAAPRRSYQCYRYDFNLLANVTFCFPMQRTACSREELPVL